MLNWLGLCSGSCTPRGTAPVTPGRAGPQAPAYRRDLLAVHLAPVQQDGVDGVARARRLHGGWDDVQEILQGDRTAAGT